MTSSQQHQLQPLGIVLARFLYATDWRVAYALLVNYPRLASPDAVSLVRELVVEAHQRGDERDVMILHSHQIVLEVAWRQGLAEVRKLVLSE